MWERHADVLQARETIAQVNARALPWLDDKERHEAVERLNRAAGVSGDTEQRSQWPSSMESVSLESFRAEIGSRR